MSDTVKMICDAPRNQLEYKLLYAVIVAGKSAKFAEAAMMRLRDALMGTVGGNYEQSWFTAVRWSVAMGRLNNVLHDARVGNYTKVFQSFSEIAYAYLDLRNCSIEDLEKLHGIGPKTSRFFLRWSGRRERFAVLDVHILRWLSERGHAGIPRSTPQSRRQYARIEQLFLQEADAIGIHPADLDQQIWLERNTSGIRT